MHIKMWEAPMYRIHLHSPAHSPTHDFPVHLLPDSGEHWCSYRLSCVQGLCTGWVLYQTVFPPDICKAHFFTSPLLAPYSHHFLTSPSPWKPSLGILFTSGKKKKKKRPDIPPSLLSVHSTCCQWTYLCFSFQLFINLPGVDCKIWPHSLHLSLGRSEV